MTNEEYIRHEFNTEGLAKLLIEYVRECNRYRTIDGFLLDDMQSAIEHNIKWLKRERDK